MLLYYYDTGNLKEFIYFLKLFLDQDIEDALKKQHLIVSDIYLIIVNYYLLNYNNVIFIWGGKVKIK